MIKVVTSVKTNVLFVVARVKELFLAVLALVNTLTTMYSHVYLKVTVVLVGLAAQFANKRPLALK